MNAVNRTWVEVAAGTLPSTLPSIIVQSVLWQANEREFLFDMPGQARFWVQQGNSIQVERGAATSERMLSLLLQGIPLAAHFVQQRAFTLHAAALSTERGAIVIAGHSAAGKSTIAAALATRGYPLLGDEITPLVISPTAKLTVQPALCDLLLWHDAMAKLGYAVEQCAPLRAGLERYLIPALPTCDTPQPLHAIYLLSLHSSPEVSLQAVSGHHRFLALQPYAFNRILPELPMIRQQLFLQHTMQLAAIRIQRLYRPRAQWSVDQLVAAIEQDLCA